MAGKCAVCGVAHATCGAALPTTSAPVDRIIHTINEGSGRMAVKEYEVKAGRRGDTTTTMLLSDEDLKLYPGAKLVKRKSATAQNKSRSSTPNKRGSASTKKADSPAPAPATPDAQPAAETEKPQETGDAGTGSD